MNCTHNCIKTFVEIITVSDESSDHITVILCCYDSQDHAANKTCFPLTPTTNVANELALYN